MKIEHVALQVPDPVAMADWYVANLGFSVARAGGEPAHARFLKDSAGSVMIEAYRHPRAATPDYTAQDPLVLHLAFISSDVAADRARLLRAGARLAEDVSTTPAGDKVLMLRDPWGIPIQLVERAAPMV